MRDIAPTIIQWIDEGRRFALARVLTTWGSAPRRVGSAMAVTDDMRIVGSVSGGCVEGEVIQAAKEIIRGGDPGILEFGVADDDAWSVGLSCGGRITVFVELFPAYSDDAAAASVGRAIVEALDASRPLIWLTMLPPGPVRHALIPPDGPPFGDITAFSDETLAGGRSAYAQRRSGLTESADRACFVHAMPPRSKLLILGASDIATHLVRMAHGLDFETIVVDPRSVFAAEERFSPRPDRILSTWPQEALSELTLDDETYAVLLTHDPKLDDPALHVLLDTGIPYIGALGSSRTHAKRLSRLSDSGLSDAQLSRIHGPVGLNLGAASPAEIALSIMAQVVQSRNRHSPT